MDCKRAAEAIFLFFDNEMDDDLLSPFQEHVSRCGLCAHRMDYTRKVLLLVREHCIRRAAPPRLRLRILTSLPHRNGPSPEI